MSRRNISKKRFPKSDSLYNSYLVSLLISRILKSGKKTIAKTVVYEAFELIKQKTNEDPLEIFEKAIRKASPIVEVKARRVGGSTYQVPIEVSGFRGTNLSLRWIIQYSKHRNGLMIFGDWYSRYKETLKNCTHVILFFGYFSKIL